MYKKIYLFKGNAEESYQEFSDRIISLASSLTDNKNIQRIKVVFTAEMPPKYSVIPFKKEKVAVISVFGNSIVNFDLMREKTGFAGAYSVDEAIPVAYEKNWNDLEPTPGVCLLTLFQRKPGLNYDKFIDRWHNSHTPLSLKIHPLWNYNRNVVTEKSSDNSESWDGIVEEHFRTSSDLLNPFRFFGNPLIVVYNMLRVYYDTNSFLDYKSIKPFFAREIHVKS